MSLLKKILGGEEVVKRKGRFREDAEAFAARCAEWRKMERVEAEGDRVGVVVSPWISTAVPFFAMECGLALWRKGLKVSILWDGVEIVGNVPNKKHVVEISRIFPQCHHEIGVIDVAGAGIKAKEGDGELARRIVYENAVRDVRGEMKVAEFFAAHPEAEGDTRAHIGRIREMLAGGGFDWVLAPGGIFGVSAVYIAMARELGLRFSTFDSGPGRLRLAHDGVAAHLADLPRAFEIVNREFNEEQKGRAMELGKMELIDRVRGADDRGFQVAAATGEPERCDVLIPLNIRWDSAALSRQRLFASVEENISAVLEWAGGKDGVTVCIRQHPNERREHLRGSDNWEGLTARFGRLGERVRWIGAADPVNTYDLIRSAKVVLPHTSTVGVEAALLGRPVVLSTRVYYDCFSFVWNPGTREEFFALLDRALGGELPVSEEAKNEALLVYFLTQRCAVMRTRFTPQNDDYRRWMETRPEALWEEAETRDLLEAMMTREPLAAIRAKRIAH
ncbi:MAG: hypothetical protein ABSE62_02710 [Chthoniobacteraceae bacterium]|jgi:hypothetical protein